MAEISRLLTYDKFVSDMLLKLNRNKDEYIRMLRITMDGMQELKMHHINSVKNSKITMDADTKTFSIPDDMMGFVSISVPWKGRMWTFTRDDRLVITTDGTAGVDEAYDVDDGEGVNVADNGLIYGFGSRGAVNRYYYTIDYKRNRIAFSGFTPTFAILQYMSTGIDTTATNYIPRAIQRVLEYYVRWMDADYSGEAQSKVAQLEVRYSNELRKIRKFFAPTFDEIKDALYSTVSQSVRR